MKFNEVDIDGFFAWLNTEHRGWFESVYRLYLKRKK